MTDRNGPIQPSNPQYVNRPRAAISYTPNFPSVASRSSASARYSAALRSTRSRDEKAAAAVAVSAQNSSSVGSICMASTSKTIILPGGKNSGTTMEQTGSTPSDPWMAGTSDRLMSLLRKPLIVSVSRVTSYDRKSIAKPQINFARVRFNLIGFTIVSQRQLVR